MEEEETESNQEVAWSADKEQLQALMKLLEKANRLYIEGKLNEYMRVLKTIKLSYMHSFEPGERKELVEMEKESKLSMVAKDLEQSKHEWIGNLDNEKVEKRDKFISNHLSDLETHVDNYREKLMMLLDAYGYLSKKKKDATKLGF